MSTELLAMARARRRVCHPRLTFTKINSCTLRKTRQSLGWQRGRRKGWDELRHLTKRPPTGHSLLPNKRRQRDCAAANQCVQFGQAHRSLALPSDREIPTWPIE